MLTQLASRLPPLAGISFKTQALYVVVFLTRYMDLLTGPYVSAYNTVMKIFFIGSSLYTLYLMKFRFRPTSDPGLDTFRLEYLLVPCVLLSLVLTYAWTPTEMMWAFSIYLEAVAILPQLFMLQRTGEAETITTHYLAALGMYRGLYLPNWIYRSVRRPLILLGFALADQPADVRFLDSPHPSHVDTSRRTLSTRSPSLPDLSRPVSTLTSVSASV